MTTPISGKDPEYEIRNPDKLNALKGLLLKRADEERETILASARAEASKWTADQGATVDGLVEQIHGEAVKRSEEISRRQITGATTAQTKDRLRLQSSLLDEAVSMLQRELTALRDRSDYLSILAGVTLESLENMPDGTTVQVQLAQEDSALGDELVARLGQKRPGMTFLFLRDPAPILGGTWLSAPDGSWRTPADWKQVISDLKDTVAERILAVL